MISREALLQLRRAITEEVPLALGAAEMLEIIALADSAFEARELMGELVPHLRRGETGYAIGLIKAWFDTNVAPQAPCTDQSGNVPSPSDATAPSQPPGGSSHKEASPPATALTSGPPGKSTGDERLPAQPADAAPPAPLERHERVCADKLASTAEAFMNSFREHLDRCRTCQINWQSMRKALGEYQGCTR